MLRSRGARLRLEARGHGGTVDMHAASLRRGRGWWSSYSPTPRTCPPAEFSHAPARGALGLDYAQPPQVITFSTFRLARWPEERRQPRLELKC
jgi:hypothetical protein